MLEVDVWVRIVDARQTSRVIPPPVGVRQRADLLT
jgi:hypothetical protein